MDLASGYSDSINYGNGYTQLATGAINNNNAEYARNQMTMALMAQAYNPYANSGGSFGAQPATYAAQGAAYTGATGGNIFGGGNNDPFGPAPSGSNGNPAGGATAESAALMLQDPAAYYRKYGGGDSGSFVDRYSAAPAIQPGLQPLPGDLPRELQWGINPSPSQPQLQPTMKTDFNSRFGAFPDPGTPMNTPSSFPGWTPNAPAAAPEQPYGGALPPFWQGVRDWTGMGAPQPQQGWQEGH